MKKIKLFALAIMAMLSINAFAAVDEELATTIFRYKVVSEPGGGNPGTANIIGFVADYPAASMATTKIPATVAHPTEDYAYNVIGITETAFAGNENITAFDFSEATNLTAIAGNAFAGTKVTSLDLTNTKVEVLNRLFETVGAQVTEIKLPSSLTTIKASAFSGLTKLETLVIPGGENAVAIEGLAFEKTMKLTTLTLPKVTIAANAFKTSYVTTLNINGVLGVDAVEAGAFVQNGTQEITINYTPSDATNVGFAQKAFAANENDTKYVTFVTESEAYKAKLVALWTLAGSYGVKKFGDPVDNKKIKVYNNGGSYAYGGFVIPGDGIKIAKVQGKNKDINVVVYGAYFDKVGDKANTSKVMMDQLHLIGGYYYLPTNAGENAFIVKSSSTEDVSYEVLTADELTAKTDSRNYAWNDKEQNEIKVYNGPEAYAIDLFVDGKTTYFLRDLAGGKEFGWKQRSDDAVINEGQDGSLYQLYLLFDGPAAARLDVVWLDGSEEDATAIQTVKKANAEKGVIYNLAGQKVNAAYKGVVIKDGQKYIQK